MSEIPMSTALEPTPEQFAALAARSADAPVVMVNLKTNGATLQVKPHSEHQNSARGLCTGYARRTKPLAGQLSSR